MMAQPADVSSINKSDIERFVNALFRYAPNDTWVSLRTFYEKRKDADPLIRAVQFQGNGKGLVDSATQWALNAFGHGQPMVFAPPICTFRSAKGGAEKHLAAGLVLSVECDSHPTQARQTVEGLLGPATVVVESGGVWLDPNGTVHPKLHLHWRLTEPTTTPEEHAKLKRARRLAALLARSDTTAVPLVHPLRWPGSWHMKTQPKLAAIMGYDAEREIDLDEAFDALEDAAHMQGVPLDEEPHKGAKDGRTASKSDLELLAEVIPNEPGDDPSRWERWNRIGMAFWVASGGSEDGLKAFDTWSQKATEIYDLGTVEDRWKHFAKSPPTKMTVALLVYEARLVKPDFRLPSWDNPRSPVTARGAEQASPEQNAESRKKLDDKIRELNERFFATHVEGRFRVVEETYDELMGRRKLVFMTAHDFGLRFANQMVIVGWKSKEVPILKKLGAAWLEHPGRRQYERMVLNPDKPTPAGAYNLWRGFGCGFYPGDWPTIREHLREIICRGDEALYDYLLRWMAYCVQNPGKQAEVAVVLKGLKGSGKGMTARIFLRIFRDHAVHISQMRQLVGNFNAHLQDACFLFVDEATWGGDRQGESALKALITEQWLTIERKGMDVFNVPNRLKVLIATNLEWSVPASYDERRFFCLEVSDAKLGDQDYFNRLDAAVEGKECEAFLKHIRELDLTGWSVRNVPATPLLDKQKMLSAPSSIQFLYECLRQGYVLYSDKEDWPETLSVEKFHDCYHSFCDDHNIKRAEMQSMLATHLKAVWPGGQLCVVRPSKNKSNNRKRHYVFESLDDHREAFAKGMNFAGGMWRDDDGIAVTEMEDE